MARPALIVSEIITIPAIDSPYLCDEFVHFRNYQDDQPNDDVVIITRRLQHASPRLTHGNQDPTRRRLDQDLPLCYILLVRYYDFPSNIRTDCSIS